jgi:hypothetical protein
MIRLSDEVVFLGGAFSWITHIDLSRKRISFI